MRLLLQCHLMCLLELELELELLKLLLLEVLEVLELPLHLPVVLVRI